MKLQNQPKCQSIDESIKKTEYTYIFYLKERSHKDQGDGSVGKAHVSNCKDLNPNPRICANADPEAYQIPVVLKQAWRWIQENPQELKCKQQQKRDSVSNRQEKTNPIKSSGRYVREVVTLLMAGMRGSPRLSKNANR